MIFPEDIFRTLPFSIDQSGQERDNLVLISLTAKEIKTLLEIASGLKNHIGKDYNPHFRGLRVTYNSTRLPMNRVTGISVRTGGKNYRGLVDPERNTQAFRIITTEESLRKIEELNTHPVEFIKILPKNIVHLKNYTQRSLNSFALLISYMKSFGDKNGNGISDIASHYKEAHPWFIDVRDASIAARVRNSSHLARIAMGVVTFFMGFFLLLNIAIPKILKRINTK